MIYMMGDIHGNLGRLLWLKDHVQPEDTVIQVGDFGVYDYFINKLKHRFPNGFPCRLLFIDGNHEDFRIIRNWSKTELTEIHKNFFYVPRGYVMEIEGELFGFLGGADSVDKAWRTVEVDWFADERVAQEDVDLLIQNIGDRTLDVLVTHAVAPFVISANFPPLKEADWGLPLGWIDESGWKVSKAYWAIKPIKHYCGHMHKAVLHANVRILNIDEVLQHQK